MIVNTLCTHGLVLTFLIRTAFGIAGFGILFTMWCATCTGVRHFKQMEANKSMKKKNHVDEYKTN